MTDPHFDEPLADRIKRLTDVPDRSNWADVVDRSKAPIGAVRARQLARGTAGGRGRRRWWPKIVAGSGVLALGALLLTLLLLSPGSDTTQPGQTTLKPIPALPANAVPPAIKAQLNRLGNAHVPYVVAPIVAGPTFSGPVQIYRAMLNDGTFTLMYEDSNGKAEEVGRCAAAGPMVVPADPPGSPRRVEVPDVAGLTPAEAQQRLLDAGLGVEMLEPPPTSPLGTIVGGVGYPESILYAAGTSVFADTVVAVPSVERLAPATAPESRPVVSCGLGVGESGHWLTVAISPDVSGGRTEWPNDVVVDGTAANGVAILPLLPNDCRHTGPPVRAVFTDASGAPITSPDQAEFKLDASWQYNTNGIEQACPKPLRVRAGYSVFEREATSADEFPTIFRESPGISPFPLDSRSVRNARRLDSGDRYGRLTFTVARTADHLSTCLFISGDQGVTGFTTCRDDAQVAAGELVSSMQHSRQGDPLVVAGVLPDEYTSVRDGSRSSSVEGNVWVLVYPSDEASTTKTIVASKSDGETLTLSVMPGVP